MKKLVSIILSLLMATSALSFVACGGNDGGEGGNGDGGGAPVNNYAGVKNVIMFIGDGMGYEHVKLAETYMGRKVSFDAFTHKTSSDTMNAWGELTDSAAGATALSTGIRTLNSYIGKNEDGQDLKTIMDFSKDAGKATGVITSDYLSGATPSGFSAHSFDRNDLYSLVNTQVASGVDFLCGEYSDDYEGYLHKFSENGYVYYDSLDENIDSAKKAIVMGDIEPVQALDGMGNEKYMMLDELTESAIEYLSHDGDGFTLMVEGAHIDKRAHANDAKGVINNVIAFDKAIKAALRWANGRTDTVIIVTADHETGGLSVNDATKSQLQYGDYSKISWTSTGHTVARVPVCVYGASVSPTDISTSGNGEYVKNTDLFYYMLSFVKGEKTISSGNEAAY